MKYSLVKKLRNIATTTMQKSNITIFLQKNLMQIRVAQCVKNVRTRSFLVYVFLSVFNPNAGKCGPEKLPTRTLFMQWKIHT